jgi:glyoxylase-like metal-dependent hydrolase (beta-lactamase superfamily II)
LYEGVLIFGDALINLEPEGLRLLPKKYREDKKLSLSSLAALRELHPLLLFFAHGNPITQGAARRLATLLGVQS